MAALLWLLASMGFSWYVGAFAHYDRTYGSLGAVVVFMTWIWLSSIIVLAGAELNSEIEAQSSVTPPWMGEPTKQRPLGSPIMPSSSRAMPRTKKPRAGGGRGALIGGRPGAGRPLSV